MMKIVQCRRFQQDKDNRDIFIGVFHDLLSVFLQNQSFWESNALRT